MLYMMCFNVVDWFKIHNSSNFISVSLLSNSELQAAILRSSPIGYQEDDNILKPQVNVNTSRKEKILK